jgi:serine/threonine protein kinase
MASPASSAEFLDLVRKSGVLDEKRLAAHVDKLRAAGTLPDEPGKLAGVLVRDGLLTHFQAEQFMLGKWRRFTIGKYKVLERLGSGGMGSVYLCEHKLMRRRVAVKVLPTAKASDPSALERFYREARAVAALDHPNIVHAYDIDQDENLHFLVMEYVDGASLQEMVKRAGPLDPVRAAHYIRQAALGLDHAHAAGLVHRDIKPGNVLVDRGGTVKVLDMGLARFFNDEEDILTKKYDENVLGTADYLAPEQALDSHSVDIRADIYSLGATFYFCLTGRTPFNEGTVAQKLIWHQTRQPKPIRTLRAEVPEGLVAVIDKMMAKDPSQRYQLPLEVVETLAAWTQTPIPPPPEAEMPRLSLAATGVPPGDATQVTAVSPAAPSPTPRKNWQVPPSGIRPKPKPPDPRAQGTGLTAEPTQATATAPPPVPAARPATVPRINGRLAAAPQPALDEESIPWERVTTDTDDISARVDTASRPVAQEPGPLRLQPGGQWGLPAATASRRRFWLVAGVVSAVVATVLVCLWLKLGPQDYPKTDPRPILHVRPGTGAFQSIGAALDSPKARDGGVRIVVGPGRYAELINLHGRQRITIEAAEGAEVVIVPPPNADDKKLLLDLADTRDVHVQGLRLDGTGRLNTLVAISLVNPGLLLERLRLQGFTDSGVAITNCAGEKDNPVRLLHLEILPRDSQNPTPAVVFRANPRVEPEKNAYVHIKHCLFQGHFEKIKAIQFDPDQLDKTVDIFHNTSKPAR